MSNREERAKKLLAKIYSLQQDSLAPQEKWRRVSEIVKEIVDKMEKLEKGDFGK